MSVTFYAQPYNLNAKGFYFDTYQQYQEYSKNHIDCYGDPVEEYEIQFIDGDDIDAAFAEACEVNQANLETFLNYIDDWDEYQKKIFIIADEAGYNHDQIVDDPYDLDIDIYEGMTMRELAEQFIEEKLFGDIPDNIAHYIDYDAIARDLSMDYAETKIAGETVIYRCG